MAAGTIPSASFSTQQGTQRTPAEAPPPTGWRALRSRILGTISVWNAAAWAVFARSPTVSSNAQVGAVAGEPAAPKGLSSTMVLDKRIDALAKTVSENFYRFNPQSPLSPQEVQLALQLGLPAISPVLFDELAVAARVATQNGTPANWADLSQRVAPVLSQGLAEARLSVRNRIKF